MIEIGFGAALVDQGDTGPPENSAEIRRIAVPPGTCEPFFKWNQWKDKQAGVRPPTRRNVLAPSTRKGVAFDGSADGEVRAPRRGFLGLF